MSNLREKIISNVEDLFGEYWNLAYREGSEGTSYGDQANDCLHRLRTVLGVISSEPAAVKPEVGAVAWINLRGDYVEVSTPSTIYGSHTIPLFRGPQPSYEQGKADGYEACETFHNIVDGRHVRWDEAKQRITSLEAERDALRKDRDAAYEALSGMLQVFGVREQHLNGNSMTSSIEVEVSNLARAALAAQSGDQSPTAKQEEGS